MKNISDLYACCVYVYIYIYIYMYAFSLFGIKMNE